ncbi:TetR/AcrR family transcriptional regulator [Microbacterium sp. p3-SID336]|uniref:TetR/AcrR family transcriptional regulator n=1 Tax=Microbacterium sp. p3-SID336 TaxID=2916212 RepID=UPI0021A47B04|nr:TetR/AcrR family transcriptional regulator [Microbacterium sp. p3-SID336]MCT1478968.1 TetR family transcriptional regulator [Microbacterium sp. p3-SID336]
MAYLPREQRRAAIVDAAASVALRSGLASVTARTVADALGGSPGLIHQHFRSMTELQIEAWQASVAAQLDDFAASTREGADALTDFFGHHLDPAGVAALGLWADAWAHALRTPAFADAFAETVESAIRALQAADPRISAVEARRALLLALALAGMSRIAPDRYPPSTVAALAGIPSPGDTQGDATADRSSTPPPR